MSEGGGVQGGVNKGNPGEVARINQVKGYWLPVTGKDGTKAEST